MAKLNTVTVSFTSYRKNHINISSSFILHLVLEAITNSYIKCVITPTPQILIVSLHLQGSQ